MNKLLATLAVATSILATAAVAQAAPTQVNVRIEGRAETLFEGPIAAEPHGVHAASDPASKLRRCDGINVNDPQNVVPAATPTAAAADAMALVGEGFDGQWYQQYEDYFVTRFGPDAQDLTVPGGAYWGLLVNNTFTAVGGCQYQLDGGDEVLWVYDAFHGRPTLALFPEAAIYASGPRPLVVKEVEPGEAVPVEVVSYADDQENNPPAAPSRTGSGPFAGAKVAPVQTSAKGFERVLSGDPAAVVSDAGGKATVSFSQPGWHRIKATVGSPGAESTIRSNRLDICVKGGGGASLEGATSCAELPLADQVRVPPASAGEVQAPGEEEGAGTPKLPSGGSSGNGSGDTTKATAAAAPAGSVRVSVPRVDRRQLAAGRVGFAWTVQSAGPGIKRWTISSQTVGAKGGRWVVRASGATRTAATIRLPAGAAYRLRFAITDALGKTATVSLGKLSVPERRPRRR